HEAEAGLLVVGERMAAHDDTVVPRQPDFLGLCDEVADGEHQAVVADDDAAALAPRAERVGGEGVVRDGRAHGDDGWSDRIEAHVPAPVLRTRRDLAPQVLRRISMASQTLRKAATGRRHPVAAFASTAFPSRPDEIDERP